MIWCLSCILCSCVVYKWRPWFCKVGLIVQMCSSLKSSLKENSLIGFVFYIIMLFLFIKHFQKFTKRMQHSLTTVPFAMGDCMACVLSWTRLMASRPAGQLCGPPLFLLSRVSSFNSRTPKAPQPSFGPLHWTSKSQRSLHSSCQIEMFPALN